MGIPFPFGRRRPAKPVTEKLVVELDGPSPVPATALLMLPPPDRDGSPPSAADASGLAFEPSPPPAGKTSRFAFRRGARTAPAPLPSPVDEGEDATPGTAVETVGKRSFLRRKPKAFVPPGESAATGDDADSPAGRLSFLRRRSKTLTVDEIIAEQVEAGELDLDADISVPVMKEKHSFAEYILSHGLADPVQVNASLLEQKVTKELLGQIMVRNGFIAPKDLITAVLSHNAERIATERVQSCRIPVETLERINTVITAETDDCVYVGTMGDESVIHPIVDQYYPDKKIVFVAFLPDLLPEFLERMRRTSAGMDEGDAREDEMMERLLYRSLKLNASDIHIEPKLDSYAVFFRRLGERQLSHMGSLEEYNTIVSQLKDRSRMDLAERRVGQDGGFQIEYAGKYVDLRVATVPAVEGEQVVIRVLDPDRVRPKLEALGISNVHHWQRGISRKNGLCLICGETGSGKTTTLNASVREIDRFGKKIYTAEDPVEYRIPYVGQVSMNTGVGYGFAQAIRNFMRADPDVIILGEVRDADTARNAVKAAETGHLVIATLHTGNIASSLSRLRDLDVPPYELRFILRSVLVQTLVKVVCKACGGHGHNDGDVCPSCGGTGYSDRTIVSECHSFASGSDVDEVIAMTERQTGGGDKRPWKEMIDDGIDKMLDGITTSEEMKRNFGSQFDDRMEQMKLNPADYLLPKNRGKAG